MPWKEENLRGTGGTSNKQGIVREFFDSLDSTFAFNSSGESEIFDNNPAIPPSQAQSTSLKKSGRENCQV